MSLKKGKLDVQRYIARCFDGKCEIEMEYIGQSVRMASVDPQSGHVRREIVLSLDDCYKFLKLFSVGFSAVSEFFNHDVYRHRFTEKGYLIQFAAVGLQAAMMIVPVECDFPPMGILTRASQWANYIEEWNNREAIE